MNNQNRLVFMVEDDQDDRFITSTTLNELGYTVPIEFFSKGEQLFSALKNEKPSLIILDYNSTPETGAEILSKLKSTNEYKSIPVVILIESLHQNYIEECYLKGASSVVQKPDSNQLTKNRITSFFDYWMNVAATP